MIKVTTIQNLVTKTALEGTIKSLLIVELDRVQKEREIIAKRIKPFLFFNLNRADDASVIVYNKHSSIYDKYKKGYDL